jgi:mono/diheme cytochrome c family protein
MSDSNEAKTGLKVLGGTLAMIVVGAMCVILGVFGVKLLGAQFSFPPPETAAEEVPIIVQGPQDPATPGEEPAPGEEPEADVVTIDPKLLEMGKTTYGTLCIACHGPDAKGMPNNMAPSLSGTEIVNGPTERIAMIVLNGIHPEGRFLGVMVSWKPLLSDDQMAGVMTFIRSNFGNDSGPITPEQFAWARDKYKDQVAPFQRAVVEKVTDDLPVLP